MEMEITEDNSRYMYDFIGKIIDECGPRMPCSIQEEKAAQIIKSEFEKTCDNSCIEDFTCHPRAFLGYIKIIVILNLISFIIFFLSFQQYSPLIIQVFTVVSFSLNLAAFLILWNEFFNYREFIDPLFKKKSSQNVIGTFKSKEKIEKVIIFSGHHDSALQFNLLKYFKVGYAILILLGLLVLILWIILSFIILLISIIGFAISEIFYLISLILFIIAIPSFVGMLFFVSPGERANKVPGAVDNLSAVAILIGIGRYLKKNKEIIPPNTEVRLISFGCEEAGLRGAYRYVASHLEELQELNANCVNMDAIQSANNISIIEFEPSTRTRHSPEIVKKIESASNMVGVKINKSSLGGDKGFLKIFGQITGGTDATAFSKSRIPAANISAMDFGEMIHFYHQPNDTPDKIQEGSLESVLKICLGYVIQENNKKEIL
ncbi:MAG: M28 family peptidase [Promethearchaeota archaeon]|nr:MAG: M28 family peptidase [Candidatus Lokiarchaeota archaeon]